MSVCKVIAGSLTEWEWEGKRGERGRVKEGGRRAMGARKQVKLEEKRQEEGREARRQEK